MLHMVMPAGIEPALSDRKSDVLTPRRRHLILLQRPSCFCFLCSLCLCGFILPSLFCLFVEKNLRTPFFTKSASFFDSLLDLRYHGIRCHHLQHRPKDRIRIRISRSSRGSYHSVSLYFPASSCSATHKKDAPVQITGAFILCFLFRERVSQEIALAIACDNHGISTAVL